MEKVSDTDTSMMRNTYQGPVVNPPCSFPYPLQRPHAILNLALDSHAKRSWTVSSAAMHSSSHCTVGSLQPRAPTVRTGDAAVSDWIHSSTSARMNSSTLIDPAPEVSSDVENECSDRRVRADAASWREMRKWLTAIPMRL